VEGQTDLLLESFGHPDRRRILTALLEAPRTEKELLLLLNLGQSAATRGLTHLRLAGLIEREAAGRRHRVTFDEVTRELLLKASDLAEQITDRRRQLDRELRTELEG
jgi:DNA-binding transcriptional ArsR family regulator